jgi:hypothetical protein
MRVNIISNFKPHTGLSQDVGILRGILTAVFDKDVEIRGVQHVHPYCDEAEYNIFVEVINPSLFSFANKNIWIPNLEWSYRSWSPYIGMFDEIWVKTIDATHILRMMVEGTSTKVVFTGWMSCDKTFQEKKNYFILT